MGAFVTYDKTDQTKAMSASVEGKANDVERDGCQKGRCCEGKCCKGKCCCMALVAVPVFLALSPIVIPMLLVRRAVCGPMKCRGKCARGPADAPAVTDDAPKKDRA